MSLPNVRVAVKTTSVTPPSITGRYQCTTQADRDVGYREWFKTVPAIYHEINMNERMGFCSQMHPPIEILVEVADIRLLNQICSNQSHVIHPLLPPNKTHTHSLRPRAHTRQ